MKAKEQNKNVKTESANVWPVIRTVRKLQVPLSDDDIRNLGRENAHIGAEIEALTAAKKAATQNYAAQITERSTKRGVNDAAISNGWSDREVECEWRYEQNRAGKADKSRKVLVRLDTGKVVDEAFITDDERQTTMKLYPVEEKPQGELNIEPATGDAKAAKSDKKGSKKDTPAPSEAAQEQDKKDSDAEANA